MTVLEKVALGKFLMELAAVDGLPNDNELMYIHRLSSMFSISLIEWEYTQKMSAKDAVTIVKSFNDSIKMKLPFMMYHLINSDKPANSKEIKAFESTMTLIGRPCLYNSFHTFAKNVD